jgi:hypothetical protein
MSGKIIRTVIKQQVSCGAEGEDYSNFVYSTFFLLQEVICFL